MSRRQPGRNPFSFKKIPLAGPMGGGGVSGGSEEGSVSGSASNNHLEKMQVPLPQSDAWKGWPVSEVHITQNVFCKQGFFGRTTSMCVPASSCFGIAGFGTQYGLNRKISG